MTSLEDRIERLEWHAKYFWRWVLLVILVAAVTTKCVAESGWRLPELGCSCERPAAEEPQEPTMPKPKNRVR